MHTVGTMKRFALESGEGSRSMHKSVEPLSDHPLFRALVLMGGSLALGCGGVAQTESPASAAADGGTSNAAAAGAFSVGGSGPLAAGAATQTAAGAGSAGASAATVYNPSCPYAQWSCAPAPLVGLSCFLGLKSKDDPLASGCTCDASRPTSASACSASEQFVCRQAYPPYEEAQPSPSTWDGTLHVQCACVPAPNPTLENCFDTCSTVFSGTGSTYCRLPSSTTCDDRGVCTATSADIQRQDGILCGCATIALK